MKEFKHILENYFICTKCGVVHHNNEKASGQRKWCRDCYNEYKRIQMQERRRKGKNNGKESRNNIR